jgi:hypothetical protein
VNYQYQWTKRMDARHTITLHGVKTIGDALNATRCWRRDLRADCPWRLLDPSGAVRAEGVGPEALV